MEKGPWWGSSLSLHRFRLTGASGKRLSASRYQAGVRPGRPSSAWTAASARIASSILRQSAARDSSLSIHAWMRRRARLTPAGERSSSRAISAVFSQVSRYNAKARIWLRLQVDRAAKRSSTAERMKSQDGASALCRKARRPPASREGRRAFSSARIRSTKAGLPRTRPAVARSKGLIGW